MKKTKYSYFYIIFLLFISNVFFNNSILKATSVDVNDTIRSDTTWASDTIKITGNVVVINSVTLTIEQGTYIEFQDDYNLSVQGRIVAIGTVDDTITFAVLNTTTGWKGLRFNFTPTSNDSSKFIYCKFQYAIKSGTGSDRDGGAFYIRRFSKILIDHCEFISCRGRYGGAIYCWYSSPIIINSIFSSNNGTFGGAAIYCTYNSILKLSNNYYTNNSGREVIQANNSSLILISNNFIDNNTTAVYSVNCDSVTLINNIISDNTGTGVSINNSTATIINNKIDDNSTYGIYFNNSTGILKDLTVNNNGSYGIYFMNSSGEIDSVEIDNSGNNGIYCRNSSPIISDVIISRSRSNGILCDIGSSPHLYNCIFNNNNYDRLSDYGGGLYCNNNSSPTITNCKIVNNEAEYGGGICCRNFSSPIIRNTIICNNTSLSGGGFFCVNNSSPILINNTICNNSSDFGGALFLWDTCTPVITNTIMWGNLSSPNQGAQVYLYDTFSQPDFYYSDVQGGTDEFAGGLGTKFLGDYINNIDSDPRFIQPTAGTGNTYNALEANWALFQYSDCVDAGIPDTSGLNLPEKDFAGNPRIYSIFPIDIGAYELQQVKSTNKFPVINDQTFSVPENYQNGWKVGDIVASDPNPGQILTYSFLSGNYDYAFGIDTLSGKITVANSNKIDFETRPVYYIWVKVADNGDPILTNKAIITINILESSSINELNSNSEVKIYPNPANQWLTIDLQYPRSLEMNYKITNTSGKVLLKRYINHNKLDCFQRINISNYPPGIYFIRIWTRDITWMEKFIVN